jgi:hypothetical protein
MSRLFKVLAVFAVVAVSASAFAADDLTVNPFLRFKMQSEFVTDQTSMDFDLSGVTIEKKFGNNFSAVVTPGFMRKNVITNVAAVAGANNTVDFVLVNGFFRINDLTSEYGDYGLALTVGQYESPMYFVEQNYQPFRFVMQPLDSRLMPANYVELGAMLSKSFFEDSLMVSLMYSSGRGMWNGYNNPVDGLGNAGAAVLTTTIAPFKTFDNEALKELALTFNWKAVGRTTATSNYNLLLGYKYAGFATSLEYLGTYSKGNTADKAMSFGASYDVWANLQPMVRWDYSDNKGGSLNVVNTYEHIFLLGVNTKWFEDKLQAAVTYDQTYCPDVKITAAKRFMISTQVSL